MNTIVDVMKSISESEKVRLLMFKDYHQILANMPSESTAQQQECAVSLLHSISEKIINGIVTENPIVIKFTMETTDEEGYVYSVNSVKMKIDNAEHYLQLRHHIYSLCKDNDICLYVEDDIDGNGFCCTKKHEDETWSLSTLTIFPDSL